MFHCVQLSFCGTNCCLSYLITAPNICYSDDHYVVDIISVTEITALSDSPKIIKCVQYHARHANAIVYKDSTQTASLHVQVWLVSK